MNLKLIVNNLSENDKIVYKNAVEAFAIKGFALVVSLFTMPVYMRYFSDNEILGVWFTVLSVLAWILNFDLGIGNGLRNKLSMALAKNDIKAAKEYISSAYWMIGMIVLLLWLVGSILIPLCSWNSFFNISIEVISPEDLSKVVQYAFLGIMLQFFLRLISSIIYALQKSAINNMLALVTSVSQLAFALIAPCQTPVENLKMFSIAYIFCVNVPLFAATIWVFKKWLYRCVPSVRFFSIEKAKSVLSLGGIFFVCQILYMIIANTNEFFITQYTGPQNVVIYQAYNKIFTLGSTLYMLALTPIWSAVSKAIAENNYNWLRKISSNISKMSFLAMAVEFMLIPFLQILMNIWLGDGIITVDYRYAACFALYGSAMIYQSGVSTITNGTGRMRIQAICYGVGVVVKFIIIDIGVLITGSWVIVVLANAVVLVPYCVIQQISLNKFMKQKN